jgi:hypothetical protein
MNTEESPPGNRKGGLPAAYPKTAKANDADQQVADWPSFRNHRIVRVRYCLQSDIWAWLEWTAASRTGGWLL